MPMSPLCAGPRAWTDPQQQCPAATTLCAGLSTRVQHMQQAQAKYLIPGHRCRLTAAARLSSAGSCPKTARAAPPGARCAAGTRAACAPPTPRQCTAALPARPCHAIISAPAWLGVACLRCPRLLVHSAKSPAPTCPLIWFTQLRIDHGTATPTCEFTAWSWHARSPTSACPQAAAP